MKRHVLILASLLTLVLSFAMISIAQNHHHHHDGPPGPMGFVLHQLNLTDAQEAKVHSLMDAQRAVFQPLMEKDFATHKSLQALIQSGNLDALQLKNLAESQAATKIAFLVEKERLDAQVYGLLTTAQQAQFDQVKANMAARGPMFPGVMPPMPRPERARSGDAQTATARPMPPSGSEMFAQMMGRKLNLTTDQQAKIDTLFTQQKDTVAPLMERMNDFHKQLQSLTANGHFDEAQVRSLAQEQLQTFADLTIMHETAMFQVYNLLTPEQQAKFFEHPDFPGHDGHGRHGEQGRHGGFGRHGEN